MEEEGFIGFMAAAVLGIVFLFGTAIGSMTSDVRVDRSIVCMEGTSDATFCRGQAGLIHE